jgi:DNA (cytosine-5)-methyltransferase 1
MLKLVSLFTGSGGFDLGFDKTGKFETVFANDFNKWACISYQRNVGDIVCDDIRNLKEVPKADVMIGGPPCQGFSTANPDRCMSDPRNWLFKEYFRVLEMVDPQLFIMENVSGMKTLEKGRVLQLILEQISEIGYNYQWDILNSYDYGAAQKRRRLIIVGTKPGIIWNFPKPTNENKTVGDVLSKPFRSDDPCHLPMISNLSEKNIERLSYIPQGGSMKDCPEEIRTNSSPQRAMRRLDMSKPSHTIVHNNCDHYYHPTEPRRITIREMARIQGYPDSYIFEGSKNEQSRQVGNSVPVTLAYNLALSVFKSLKAKESD